MQRVAMEMNQAETAFLREQDGGFSLRWFTPLAEVDLCGHATLASTHYLWEEGLLPQGTAHFHTRSGVLGATRAPDGAITLDFPAIESRPVAGPDDLATALGIVPETVLRGDFDLICVLQDAAAVRAVTPDFAAVSRWDARGVIVTAPGDRAGIDFISRCFFPSLGVPEDPVTGSAHCALALYWREVLGRSTMTGLQASARSGTVRCDVLGNRVRLAGKAITTLKGTFLA